MKFEIFFCRPCIWIKNKIFLSFHFPCNIVDDAVIGFHNWCSLNSANFTIYWPRDLLLVVVMAISIYREVYYDQLQPKTKTNWCEYYLRSLKGKKVARVSWKSFGNSSPWGSCCNGPKNLTYSNLIVKNNNNFLLVWNHNLEVWEKSFNL